MGGEGSLGGGKGRMRIGAFLKPLRPPGDPKSTKGNEGILFLFPESCGRGESLSHTHPHTRLNAPDRWPSALCVHCATAPRQL